MIGKIQLVKTFAMPKFMYQASLISFDKDTIKSINSVIYLILCGEAKIKLRDCRPYLVNMKMVALKCLTPNL